MSTLHRFVVLVTLLAIVPLTHAHEDQEIEEVVVYGRADSQLAVATSASEGRVGFDDIRIPPLQRVGELVEAVPGMVATQHSGTGKANQYFLRGFNLDHGTDFSASAEGVPLNMRTHGHGQGYLDLNFLIPELVEVVNFKKGPYHASVGDFSSAASVDFEFVDRLDASLLQASLGEDDYRHGLVATTVELGDGETPWTTAIEATTYDGPWQLEENLRQFKAQSSLVADVGAARVKAILQHYDNEWDATDQIPRRAVNSGLIDDLGFIDPDLGGETRRTALSVAASFDTWHLSLYAIDYDFTLFSNFSYFLNDPSFGDEFEQRDDRRVYGAHYTGTRGFESGDLTHVMRWGLSARFDDIDEVGLYGTTARQRFSTIRSDEVQTWSADGYFEIETTINERLRSIVGVRADHLDWDVTAQRSANSGSGDDVLVSPKLSLAYLMSDQLELYANWGRGFHSNDVRGSTISVDPVSLAAADPVDALVRSLGYELGARYERNRAFNASVAVFRLDLDSELVFVGDAGATEANGASTRTGIELASFWQINDRFSAHAAYTWTDPEFEDGPDKEIPGAVSETFTLGLNAVWPNSFTASLRVRYLGDAPLIEDDSVRSDDSLLVNVGIGRSFGAFDWRLEIFNLLDSDDDDIAYFYASRLAGEPAGGVDDVHFHPLEPRTVRATVTWRWSDTNRPGN